MESYGDILKKAREAKNLSVEQVERETSIIHQYIIGLEEEQSDVFPGEPYLIGFLQNYAEYLGLNPENLLRLYHAKKIQESPIPRELLQKNPPKFLLPLIITLAVLLIVGGGIYLFFFVFKIPEKRKARAELVEEKVKIHQYEFLGETETHRMYKGDQILLPAKTGDGHIVLTVSNTVGDFAIHTPAGTQHIALSEERELDIDGDGEGDIILYVSDVSSSDASRGAEVRMIDKNSEDAYIDSFDTEENSLEESTLGSTIVNTSKQNSSRQVVIHEDNRTYPFTIRITFRSPCVFRYLIDPDRTVRRNTTVENYYRNGDSMTLSPNDGVRIWTSNINAMRIQVVANTSSYDLEVGKAGQVGVEDIKWVRSGDRKYSLVVQELD